jgi:hypothetical protein
MYQRRVFKFENNDPYLTDAYAYQALSEAPKTPVVSVFVVNKRKHSESAVSVSHSFLLLPPNV